MSRKNTNKYYIHSDTYDTYAFTPKLCVLDAIRFFEFNSYNHKRANFYCYASNQEIEKMAIKKAASYGIQLTERQVEDCLKNCKRNGDLIKILNLNRETGEKRCPMCKRRYLWATKVRACISDKELEDNTNKSTKFDKMYPNLVKVKSDFIQYLRDSSIIVNSSARIHSLEKELKNIIEQFPNNDEEHLLSSYLDYLQSPQYSFQLKKNKYCPRITSIGDVSSKFGAIRAFKNDRNRHFDPNKHLSEKWQ